jgi:long-subunit acyl-CoA synthetase (AMP-forming)
LSEADLPKRDDPAFRAELEKSLPELMKKVNATLDPHEALQFLVVVKDTWDIENGFLTPTMKIKRDVIEDTYKSKIDGWYASREKLIWE